MGDFHITIKERVKESANTHSLKVALVNFMFGDTQINNSLCSDKFNIDDRIDFQAKFVKTTDDCLQYFVKFNKRHTDDVLNYHILHNYSSLTISGMTCVGSIKSDKFPVNDTWHLHKDRIPLNCYPMNIMEFTINLDPLVESYGAIYEDTAFTDVELRGIDGSVRLHKVVAAYSCPFFKTLFCGSWRETNEGVVNVPGATMATLQHLKDYIYLGRLPDADSLRPLLLLASCYMMKDLERRCLYMMTRHVNPANIVGLIEFAMSNQMFQLLVAILQAVRHSVLSIEDIPVQQHAAIPLGFF